MTKQRMTILALAGLLALTALPADAKGPRRSGVDYRLEDYNHHVGVPHASAGSWEENQAYAFPLMRGERFVSVSIADEGEGPVAGAIVQRVWDVETEGAKAGHSVTHFNFCGETEEPVKVVPRIEVEIVLKKGTCQDGTPSTPTNGHIFIKFYKR